MFCLFDVMAHRAVFRWAGKLVQIQGFDSDRLSSEVFCCKDWHWIQSIAIHHHGRPLHGRKLRTWRWEKPLYKCFGDNWQALAEHPAEWSAREADFLQWRRLNCLLLAFLSHLFLEGSARLFKLVFPTPELQ